MQMDAVEDGYVDHELFSLASMKVCFNLFASSISNQVLFKFFNNQEDKRP